MRARLWVSDETPWVVDEDFGGAARNAARDHENGGVVVEFDCKTRLSGEPGAGRSGDPCGCFAAGPESRVAEAAGDRRSPQWPRAAARAP